MSFQNILIKTFRIKCKGIIINGECSFEQRQEPIIIIVTNALSNNLNENEIPKNFYLGDKSYTLIGFTLFKNNHYLFKIYDGKDFFLIDNLKNYQANRLINYEITHIFYEIE